MKNIPTGIVSIADLTCPDHQWCWGSCVFPHQPSPGPVEHRTMYRVFEPADELIEKRSDRRRSIATGMAQRAGDRAPLVHLGIQTSRRDLAVHLTFQETMQLIGDLSHAAGVLSREESKNDVLLRCPRCRVTYHPEALGGYGRPCRDCGGQVYEVGTRANRERGERAVDKIHGNAWGVAKVECRDCDCSFAPDSSPHPDRCWQCAARVDGEVPA